MDETRCASELLFRYIMARYLCNEGTLSPGAPDCLAREISHGRRVFDEVLILTDASPRIIADTKAAEFFVAIINQDDGAMPHMDAAELAAWRRYVWGDAPLPLRAREPQVGERRADANRQLSAATPP